MQVVLAPDAFKGSLTAGEVAAAMAAGWDDGDPSARCVEVPMADGGEGTVDALVDATDGTRVEVPATGPYGQQVGAVYGLLGAGAPGDEPRAVVEMAAASGLHLRPVEDPPSVLGASSVGTGELLLDALDRGVRRVVLGIGGSATSDGGTGMLRALGVRFLDADGAPLGTAVDELLRLDRIDLAGLDPRLADCAVELACDVDNPLTGTRGAARVFAPQKGATPEEVEVLDRALVRLGEVVADATGVDHATTPGAGGAGGVAFAAMALLGASARPGVRLVADTVGLDAHVGTADLVVTGEGRLDGQTAGGKTIAGVVEVARRHDVPVVALVGSVGPDAARMLDAGLTAWLPIVPGPVDLDTALADGAANLRAAARNLAAVWTAAAR